MKQESHDFSRAECQKVIHEFNNNGNADDVLTIVVTNWDNEEPLFVGKPSELLMFIEGHKEGDDDD